jgi:hypothetical protein
MPDHSRARLFYDEVVGKKERAFAFLASLLDGGEAAAENGWRDYKEAGFLGKTGNPDEEKEKIKIAWSENLSSFSNTGGGVLIWGFHTKGKIPDKLSLAPDCLQLADLLRTLVNDATDPYVAGVEIEAIKSQTDPNAGIVICFIPASTFAPHQAQWGERTYFIRTQDSNLPCPPPLLRNMFYPRMQSRLEPIVKMMAWTQQGGSGIEVSLETRIASRGPATAEVAMIQVEPRDLSGSTIHFDNQWEELGANLVKYRYPLPPNLIPPHLIRIRGVLLSSGASAVFRFFTHNTPVHLSTVSFSQEEVLQHLNKKEGLKKQGSSNPIFP